MSGQVSQSETPPIKLYPENDLRSISVGPRDIVRH